MVAHDTWHTRDRGAVLCLFSRFFRGFLLLLVGARFPDSHTVLIITAILASPAGKIKK